MTQLSDNENSKELKKKLSSKEQSFSERLTSTDSDINAYSIAPIPASLNQPPVLRSFHVDATKALANTESPSSSIEFEYAGFIRRYFAALIDDFFLYWLVLGFIGLYVGAEIISMHFLPRLLGVDFSRQMFDAANIILLIPAVPLSILLCWLYCAGLESSAMEATPGKRLLRMRVLDIEGRRLTFWRSTRKALIPGMLVLVAIICWLATIFLILYIKGPLAVLATCVTVVLGVLAGVAFLAACLGNIFFINKKNQTLHDLFSERIVVKRSKEAPSNSPLALFGLLPLELKIAGLVCSAILVFIAEFAIAGYLNVETKNSTQGVFVLNTSGHVWKTKHGLKAGSIVDLKDCYQETLPVFRTPPFALDPSAKLGHIIVCDNIASGSILTYNSVIPQAIGVSQIISIEPIQESQELDFPVSRVYGGPGGISERSAKHIDRQLEALKAKYPDEQWLVRILSGEVFHRAALPPDDIDKLRAVAVESNKSKKFAKAVGSADKAFSLIFEKYEKQIASSDSSLESETGDEPEGTSAKKANAPSGLRPSEAVEQAITTSKVLPKTFPFEALSVEYRAVLTDLLMQRSIAQTGLNHEVKAKVDAANCISLFKSLHEDFLVDRKSDYLGVPEFEGLSEATTSSSSDAQEQDLNAKADAENANRYLSMLAKSDEKRYKDFLRHILNRLGN